MNVQKFLLLAAMVLLSAVPCLAQAVEDVGGAGRKAVTEDALIEDGTVFINETGLLVSAPPPPDYKGPPRYIHMFVDSKNRSMALLPCEIYERLQRFVRMNEKGKVEVFLSETGNFKELADDEIIVFRVIRGISSRYGKQNFIVIQDAAYKLERRLAGGEKGKEGEGKEGTKGKKGEGKEDDKKKTFDPDTF